MKKHILVFALGLFAASTANAGDAGCGLGSVIISKNSKLLQLFAMTTNHTFFSQPLGITSGTSNCSSNGLVMNEKATQYFAEVNQQDLSREMAQGQGEKLRALASLYGCNRDGQEAFVKMAQASYGKILPAADTSASEMVANLHREVDANPEVAKSCRATL